MPESKTRTNNHTKEFNNTFKEGLRNGIAVGLGYLSVSFSFGILAVSSGLTLIQTLLISIANLTSAGQVAGLGIMTGGGTLIEMAISQFIINLRYGLMSISLSQRTDSSFNTPTRLLLATGITDEIFGVAMSGEHVFGRKYYMGLMVAPIIGWNLGTLLGALAGSILPDFVVSSLEIGIYGMFVAIVLPVAKKNFKLFPVVFVAIVFSLIFKYVPVINHISSGFSAIISALIAAILGALLFPVEDKIPDEKAVADNG